jgi:hypothetical protein
VSPADTPNSDVTVNCHARRVCEGAGKLLAHTPLRAVDARLNGAGIYLPLIGLHLNLYISLPRYRSRSRSRSCPEVKVRRQSRADGMPSCADHRLSLLLQLRQMSPSPCPLARVGQSPNSWQRCRPTLCASTLSLVTLRHYPHYSTSCMVRHSRNSTGRSYKIPNKRISHGWHFSTPFAD